ncbi:MAG TPA: nuclear transport factor 2 family protein [Allosphingosinicella sp.]
MRIPASSKPALLLGSFLLLCGCAAEAPDSGSGDSNGSASAEPASPVLSKQPVDASDDEAQLIALEREYARALVDRDRAFLMRFYAPDWRGGNWMGFWSKATMLKSVLNARYVVKSMKVRDLKVRLMGDVAVVQGVDEEVTSVDGRDTSGKWAFTDVFARRNGAWVAVASHTSEIKPTGQ